MMDPKQQPGIRIGQIFLARAEFGHTKDAPSLPPNTPVGNIVSGVQIKVGVNDTKTAGMVSVTVETKPENEALYRFVVEMIGLFEADSDSNMDLAEYVKTSGPATLYPFLRETVATLTSKGRFGPVWLTPFNFMAVTDQYTHKPSAARESQKQKTP